MVPREAVDREFVYIVGRAGGARARWPPKDSPQPPKVSPKPSQSLPRSPQSLAKASQSLPKASQSLPKLVFEPNSSKSHFLTKTNSSHAGESDFLRKIIALVQARAFFQNRHATLPCKVDIDMPQTLCFTILVFRKPCVLPGLSQ